MKISVGQRQLKVCLVALFALLVSVPGIYAMDVSGSLSTGEWTISDSPVRVIGDLVLPGNEILTVNPGVRIEFTGPYSLTIQGQLRAVGKADSLGDSLIVFTAEQPAVDSLRWKGIRFVNSNRGSELKFCRIEYGWARGTWPENCGGGLYIESSSVNMSRCEIMYNRSEADGGGIYGWFTTSRIQNCLIASNYSRNFGGGLFIAYSTPQIINCTVAFDTARGWGGGVFLSAEAKPTITNCIITNNVQQIWGGQLQPGDEYYADLARVQSSQPTVTYSCIRERGENVFPGAGNLLDNPEFLNNISRPFDFHLNYYSPCVDAGDPGMNPRDEPDVLVNRINMGAYGGTEEATSSVPVFYNNLIDLGVGIEFDSIRINSISSYELNVENRGHYRMFINEMQFSSPAFFPDSVENDNDSLVPAYSVAPIEPGERIKLAVNFLPTELRTYNETVTFLTSDTLHAVPVIDLTGTGIDPVAQFADTLNFGALQIGGAYSDTLLLTNVGQSDLRVLTNSNGTPSIDIQGDGFEVDADLAAIRPGRTGRVWVDFEPLNREAYQSVATIRTNDRNLILVLQGSGIGPKMVIEADTLFLGYVYAGGDTSTYTIEIENKGGSNLIINQALLSQNVFSVNLPVDGLTIPSDGSTLLPVNFHPNQAGVTFEDNLIIRSSNYPIPDTIGISGVGMAEPGNYVFGEVTGTWDWIEGQTEDYIVLDSVYVPPHERLKIMPGARILFEPGAKFQSDGEVRAIGLPTDSIYFLPRDVSGSQASRWEGIEVVNEDGTRLAYCVIEHSLTGVKVRESSPLIQFCWIHSNGDSTDNQPQGNGGGIYLENCGAYISGCLIENNFAMNGGGIFALNSKPSVTNCHIRSNFAETGGGIYLSFQAGAVIQSNLLYWNIANTSCGGIYIKDHSSPRILNNTIVDNSGAGIEAAIRSVPILVNDILWDNGSSIALDQNSNALVSYCDIQGGFRGTSNLDTIPGFTDQLNGDFSLADGSLLIDKGNPESTHRDYYFPPSKGSAVNDMGAFGGPLGGGWETPRVSVTVFQNPAFPRWMDLFVLSLDSLTGTPACSLEVEDYPEVSVPLSQIDAYTYRGSFEASQSGTVFIGAVADLTGGNQLKIGRTFELALFEPSEGGTMSIPGIEGSISFAPNSFMHELVIFASVDNEAPYADGLLPLSSVFVIDGINEPLAETAVITIPFDCSGWDDADLDRIGIYNLQNERWLRLDSEFRGDCIIAGILLDGKFIMALEDGYIPSVSESVPHTMNLMRAYPNPFNRKVTIEYSLSHAGKVRFAVYDLAGRSIKTLVDEYLPAGKHTAVWDGSHTGGDPVPSGIYWARLDGSGDIVSIKLLLLR